MQKGDAMLAKKLSRKKTLKLRKLARLLDTFLYWEWDAGVHRMRLEMDLIWPRAKTMALAMINKGEDPADAFPLRKAKR